MKRINLILLATCLSLCANAQNDTRISVVAGERPISEQLTEEQKASVTHLVVAGQLTDADYDFIRTSLLGQLDEIDLKDATIEELPAHAFELVTDIPWYQAQENKRKIICPPTLKHVGDSCFRMNDVNCTVEITGRFPTLGNDVHYGFGTRLDNPALGEFTISDENPYCKRFKYDDWYEFPNIIYSADGDTLFWGKNFGVVNDGTKVIAGHAFEGCYVGMSFHIPASVDSIGDRAFYNINWEMITGWNWNENNFVLYNESDEPQKLGKDVFAPYAYDGFLKVPAQSVKIYAETNGWKEFKSISAQWTSIKPIMAENDLKVHPTDGGYTIESGQKIKTIISYDASGRCCNVQTINDNSATLQDIAPTSIIKIIFDDNSLKTIKIR